MGRLTWDATSKLGRNPVNKQTRTSARLRHDYTVVGRFDVSGAFGGRYFCRSRRGLPDVPEETLGVACIYQPMLPSSAKEPDDSAAHPSVVYA